MSKKIFCLALALMMLVCSTAFAAGSISSGSASSGSPSSGSASSGSPSSGSTSSSGDLEGWILDVDPSKEAIAQDALQKLMAAIVANGGAVVKAFGDEAEAVLAALEGVDVATLNIETVIPVILSGYDASYGDQERVFITTLADDINVIAAAFGLVNGEEITWYILDAELVADDTVKVIFTQDVLTQIPEGSDLVLAVLSAQ